MRRKQEKRSKILFAAIKVFAQKGFYNTKVADIAREAGVADGTIYLYFKNKDDLLISIFEEKMDEILGLFKARLKKANNAREKLEIFFKTYFRLINDDQDLAEVFQVELRQSSKFLKDYHHQKFFDYLNIIGDIIKQGQNEKIFRQDLNPLIAKRIIFGAIDEVARQWILGAESEFSTDEACREVIKIIGKGLLQNRN
ncbi:MAG: TetR/AcrR family transcriptional regulator [Calditrichaeota bacterium]|nr:TetR/AcrR family transcriptional regulator [Calditrichota bacterium]